MNETSLILQINYGGLGDHLFYSHIPRIAKESGLYQSVYISNHSIFRSEGIKNLIWDLNPYIDGYTNAQGAGIGGVKPKSGMNLLDQIMYFYGLDNGKRFNDPEIYYRPKIIDSLSNDLIFDPNYISNIGCLSEDKLKRYFGKNLEHLSQMISRDRSVSLKTGGKIMIANDIFEYVDIIASCKRFYCLTSGGATLASAIGVSSVVFYGYGQNIVHRHSKIHDYRNITSFVSIPSYYMSKLLKIINKRVIDG